MSSYHRLSTCTYLYNNNKTHRCDNKSIARDGGYPTALWRRLSPPPAYSLLVQRTRFHLQNRVHAADALRANAEVRDEINQREVHWWLCGQLGQDSIFRTVHAADAQQTTAGVRDEMFRKEVEWRLRGLPGRAATSSRHVRQGASIWISATPIPVQTPTTNDSKGRRQANRDLSNAHKGKLSGRARSKII